MNHRVQWIGFLTLLEKEILRFVRVGMQTILSPLINAVLYLLIFGVSLASLLKTQQGVTYLEFLIPGLVALSSLNNSLQNSASSIMISKFHGDLQDLRVVPLTALSIVSAYSLACLMRGLLVGFLVLILGEIVFFFRMEGVIYPAHPLSLVVTMVLGCLIFGNFGIWAGFISKSFDHINAVTNFIVLPLIYLGGVFFSLSILHPFWQKVALFNPMVYFINGMRWGILGISDIPFHVCLGVSAFFVAVSSGLAWYSVRNGSYQRF